MVAVKDRVTNKIMAEPIENRSKENLLGFIERYTIEDATVYTDEAPFYRGMTGFNHEIVTHSIGNWVNGMAHTNGVESFWSLLKRGYHGIYHHMSPKHLFRYVNEFQARHNDRESDTEDQMIHLFHRMSGRRLTYAKLIE